MNRMNKLISHNRSILHGRDSIGLSFEYIEENQVKVSKVFFDNREMGVLFFETGPTLEKINIIETAVYISLEELQFELIDLYTRTNLNKFVAEEEFIFIINKRFTYYDEEVGDFIDDLNDFFFGIHYSIRARSFEDDEYKSQIELYLQRGIAEYSKEAYGDFIYPPRLDEVLDEDSSLYELRVFNVGQANCSALIKYTDLTQQDYRVVFVFDFGCDSYHKRNAKLNEMISKIDKDTFVLISHFHTDHFNNIASHLLIKTRRWIFPNCYTKAVKANRLFHVLLRVAASKTTSGTIYRFSSPFSFSSNIQVSEYSGPAVTSPIKNSLINLRSLVSVLSINNTKVLLPADATYEVFQACVVSNKYDYVLLPHHGCYYPNNSIGKSIVNPLLKDTTLGIVQGGINSYGHPNCCHLSLYPMIKLLGTKRIYCDRVNYCTLSYRNPSYFPIIFKK